MSTAIKVASTDGFDRRSVVMIGRELCVIRDIPDDCTLVVDQIRWHDRVIWFVGSLISRLYAKYYRWKHDREVVPYDEELD